MNIVYRCRDYIKHTNEELLALAKISLDVAEKGSAYYTNAQIVLDNVDDKDAGYTSKNLELYYAQQLELSTEKKVPLPNTDPLVFFLFFPGPSHTENVLKNLPARDLVTTVMKKPIKQASGVAKAAEIEANLVGINIQNDELVQLSMMLSSIAVLDIVNVTGERDQDVRQHIEHARIDARHVIFKIDAGIDVCFPPKITRNASVLRLQSVLVKTPWSGGSLKVFSRRRGEWYMLDNGVFYYLGSYRGVFIDNEEIHKHSIAALYST